MADSKQENVQRFLKLQKERFDDCKKDDNYSGETLIILILTDFYETVLCVPGMKYLKGDCKKMIYEMNPSFAKGYFETKKKK